VHGFGDLRLIEEHWPTLSNLPKMARGADESHLQVSLLTSSREDGSSQPRPCEGR
jgi:hypothetical protein